MIPPSEDDPAKRRYAPTRQVLPAIMATSRLIRLCRRDCCCLFLSPLDLQAAFWDLAEKNGDFFILSPCISCACLFGRDCESKISSADRLLLF